MIFALGVCAVYAQTLNATQNQLKNEIFNALKKIGTNLKDDGNEVIRFTSQEINYIVQTKKIKQLIFFHWYFLI